jgi:hypothetical protein
VSADVGDRRASRAKEVALARHASLVAVSLCLSCSTSSSTTAPADAADVGATDDGSVVDAPENQDSTQTDTTPLPDAPPTTSATIGPCRIFPPDNPWNRDVSSDPVSAHSADYLAQMNGARALHPDWGNYSTDGYGIAWNIGSGNAPVPFTWSTSWGAGESDPLPCSGSQFCYPIPTNAKIEGNPSASSGSDRHLLFLDTTGAPNDCTLYEVYNAQNFTGSPWVASNGAIFHLGTNTLRPDGWTSSDAAGLPVLPGLVRYDEVMAGEVKHAIRFTMSKTANYFIHPATHAAASNQLYFPPMGLRLRLKASVDVSAASAHGKVILAAMKKYGLIVADNGSDWYLSGDSDDRWDPIMGDLLGDFGRIHGSDFEVVESGAPIPQP